MLKITPKVHIIYISARIGELMTAVSSVWAIAGRGLEGDRYASNEGGSWNKGRPGKRQVTLIDLQSFAGTGIEPHECRRNIITEGIYFPELLNPKFRVQLHIETAILEVVKYCDPCNRPDDLSGKTGFKNVFSPDQAGIIASVICEGRISKGDEIRIVKQPLLS